MIALFSALLLAGSAGQSIQFNQAQTQGGQNSVSNQLVSYHGEAESLAKALAGISMASSGKMQFKVGDSLKNEVIVVDVNNVPLITLMDKIATVECAKWTVEGNLAFLTADQQAIKARDNATYTAKANDLLKALNAPPPEKKKASNDEDAPGYNYLDELSGYKSQDSNELLKLIGPMLIVSMQKGDRIVFSTDPTAMQRPFPNGSMQLVDKLAKQAENTPTFSFGSTAIAMPSVSVATSTDISANNAQAKKAPIAKVDLVLSNKDTFGGISGLGNLVSTSAVLLVFDAKGKMLGQLQLNIPVPNDNPIFTAVEAQLTKTTIKSNPDSAGNTLLTKPVTLSGTALEMYKAQTGFKAAEANLSKGSISQFIPYVLDPVKYEPLTVPGAVLAKSAEAYQLNLVASLPDSFYDSDTQLLYSKDLPSPKQDIDSLNKNSNLIVKNAGGWLTIGAALPSVSQANRISRNYLKKVVNYFSTTNEPDVTNLSQIAVALNGRIGSLEQSYFSIANPGFMLTLNWHLLQLYGLLSEGQRNTLNQDGKIPFSSLTGEASTVAQKLVFGADEQLYTDIKPKNAEMNDAFGMLSELEGGPSLNNAQGYESEPTEIAPTGIPTDAPISGKISKESVYHMHMESGKDDGVTKLMEKMPLSAGMVAMFMAIKDQPGMEDAGQNFPTIASLSPGSRTSLTIKIYVSPTIYAGGTIHEDYFSPEAKTISADDLPGDVKSSIEKYKNLFKDSMAGSATNSGTGP